MYKYNRSRRLRSFVSIQLPSEVATESKSFRNRPEIALTFNKGTKYKIKNPLTYT